MMHPRAFNARATYYHENGELEVLADMVIPADSSANATQMIIEAMPGWVSPMRLSVRVKHLGFFQEWGKA